MTATGVILPGLLDGAGHASCDSCSSVMRSAHSLIVDQSAQLAVARDVIRRLRNGWVSMPFAGGEPRWCRDGSTIDRPDLIRSWEPMTPAERTLLDAAAGPDDTEEHAGG